MRQCVCGRDGIDGSLNSDGERRGRTGRLRRTWSCHGHRNSCSKESFGSLNNGIVVVRPVVFTLTKALIFLSNLPFGRRTAKSVMYWVRSGSKELWQQGILLVGKQ